MIIRDVTDEDTRTYNSHSISKGRCGDLVEIERSVVGNALSGKWNGVLIEGYNSTFPVDLMVEISESEYNRIKALREPTQELTVAEIEKKLGHKVKIIK